MGSSVVVQRRRCWWLAGVVSCGTTSVVLVASRGCQLWYDIGSVVVITLASHTRGPGCAENCLLLYNKT